MKSGEGDLDIARAGPEDAPTLAALLELYAYDFSEILGLDVGPDGRFGAVKLDDYWTAPGRHAFLFHVDGKLAGLALIRDASRLTGEVGIHDMEQFFVLRRYRRLGIGRRAATYLFVQFPGRWEVRAKAENLAGAAFWRGVIDRYTRGHFEETALDDDRWQGPVQSFES